MSEAFRSSDEFDEQAHQLYNEGRYDEALDLLREGLALYPQRGRTAHRHGVCPSRPRGLRLGAAELRTALALDPDHEDALAGLGEVLLKLGDRGGALGAFDRIVSLGFQEDLELMLQIGRAPASARA